MMPFIQGALIAMGAAFGIGPGTALQWSATSRKGIGAGAMAIAGLYFSDILLLSIACFSPVIHEVRHIHSAVLTIIGGGLLIALGVSGLIKKPAQVLPMLPSTAVPAHGFFLQGFFLNICNPIAVVFWLGMLSFGSARFNPCSVGFFIFIATYLGTSITLDFCKCMLFCHVQQFCSSSVFVWANRLVSVIIIGTGIAVLVR
jgi:threonine/homoserine/homoserine lactone efflux protein